MPFSQLIARLVTRHRGVVWLMIAVVSAISLWVLATRIHLDTEILNLLPSRFESVQGLKVYNQDFAQTRELTFALVADPQDVPLLEEFAPHFADELRRQPWTVRVLAGSPMETPDGIRDLQGIALPLLLNLPPNEFKETIGILEPGKLTARLTRLRQELEAGSPKPELELSLDPLGLVTPALKPFATNASIRDEQPLISSDGTAHIFLAVTNQPTLSAFDCQKLMRDVNAFCARAHDGWSGAKPLQVLVTGRSAYVAEISLSMRHDIVVTLLGSVLLVGGVFYIGFRRWLPLLGMALSLLLCCLVALAAGLLIFRELNMVTVGFCAILIGLGVDFAILVFGKYQQARDEGADQAAAIASSIHQLGRAIFFGALTTAVGFLALTLSGSAGFTQLGVLIAIGISFAALFMTTVFFLFLPRQAPKPHRDWILSLVDRHVRRSVRNPGTVLAISLPILLILTAIAASPKPAMPFDVSTKSMEPKHSDAGYALATIMSKMPIRWEPVAAILRAPNEQQLHDWWQAVETHWAQLRERGLIKSFSTPAALALSPRNLQSNRAQISQINFPAARKALEAAIAANGFSRESFASGFQLLDQLQRAQNPATPLPSWRSQLPKTSSWWFLVDRYFAHDPLLTTGFVTTNKPIETQAQKEMLRLELPTPRVPLILSGWSFTLTDLVPWSRHQLIVISILMAFFDASLLAVLYRDLRLWLIQIATLIMAIGSMLASMKLLNIPLNLLNVLAFRLVLAIGVDYGIYVILVWQKSRGQTHEVAGVVKPVILAGLTAIAGFGSLGIANNPTLSGLGIACALGLFWSLAATIFFTLPAASAAKSNLPHDQTEELSPLSKSTHA